ncbi:MAG: acyltransferase [Methanobrevibacter sp.]|nr:acyltransferase [Methanobrevibacter sp.]
MVEKTKKRIFYYDELRALAIIMVVLCHVVILYRPFTYDTAIHSVPGLFYILTHVAVPIFFMLSGALLLDRTYDLPGFFKKRFTRILLPFLFWAIIAAAISVFGLHNSYGEAYKIFSGKNRWTWFVWAMMGIYLVLPIVNSFIKRYKIRGAEYFIIVWLVTVILSTFHQYPFYRLELSYFAGYMGYLVLGYWIVNKNVRISDLNAILIGFLLFISSISIDFYVFMNNIPKIETKYLSLFVVIASFGVFLMFKRYAHYCDTHQTSLLGRLHSKIENGKLGRAIFSISVCSYGMYLVNSLLYKIIKDFITINTLKIMPILFIGVLFLSWLFVYALSKVPALKKFSGAG